MRTFKSAIIRLVQVTKHFQLISFSLVITLTIPGASTAQAQRRDQQVLDSMRVHVQSIRIGIPPNDRTAALCTALDQLITRLSSVQGKFSDSEDVELYASTTADARVTNASSPQKRERPKTKIGESYISSLRSDDELLSGLLGVGVSDADRRQALASVKEDLEIKLKFLNRGNFVETCRLCQLTGFPTRLTFTAQAGEVLVRAQTLAGNQDIAGYRIYFVPQGWIKDPNHFLTFSSLSSPTREEYLAPGPYFIWAVKDSTTTDRNLIRIGTQGPTQIVQIAVPAN
jgi:hypothetical protein